MKQSFDWPGWELSKNKYGKEFDLDARERMFSRSRKLLPFLKKYKKNIGKEVLDIGPFFIPLASSRLFPKSNITYWENDKYAIRYLKKNFKGTVKSMNLDKMQIPKKKFDTIIISQVLNYIDANKFLNNIAKTQNKGSLLFINNVANYGLPPLFSPKRPKNNAHTVKLVKDAGYKIIEKNQENKGLIVIAVRN